MSREKIKMSTKLALLKSGEYIISDAKELLSNEKVCGYLFSNPHKIILNSSALLLENLNEETENTVSITLSPWIILSDDKDVLVSLDSVVTVVEPIDSLKKMFEEKVNGKECEVSIVEN